MAALLKQLNPAISQYKDRRFVGSQQEFEECLHTSTTAYVGNLSFFTTEDQIFEASAGLVGWRKEASGFVWVHWQTMLAAPPMHGVMHAWLRCHHPTHSIRHIPSQPAGLLQGGGREAHCDGAGQAQADTLRLLLCGVLHAGGHGGLLQGGCAGAAASSGVCWRGRRRVVAARLLRRQCVGG